MSRPFLVVQLSDPHIGAQWGGDRDPESMLAAALESVRTLQRKPDAVLVSGDLTENAADREYEKVRELLASLDAPLYVLPGNHDDRGAMRRHFGIAGVHDQPLQYAADLGPLRLVVLDSTCPGQDHGALDAGRLAWLAATLASQPEIPTLLAMHHPPLVTGVPALDAMGLPVDDRRALGELLEGYPHVRGIAAGHLHRTMSGSFYGHRVVVAGSTYVQAELDFGATEIRVSNEHSTYAVHALLDGELLSYVQPVHAMAEAAGGGT